MFLTLWHRLWNSSPVSSREKGYRGGERRSRRPRLEPLEGRLLQATWGGGTLEAPLVPPDTLSSLPQQDSLAPGYTTPMEVTVDENSSATVINLGAAFDTVSGLQHEDGLRLSILGNTNSGLVRPDLSEAALTLTYTWGQYGTATITVCATDADGVSAKQAILVTVRPLLALGPILVSPIAPPLRVAVAPGTSS